VTGSKVDFLPEGLRGMAASLRDEARASGPLGLYLHLPFCIDRCTYCSFVTTRDDAWKPATVARLREAVQAWGGILERPAVDTLYFGGGTPSVLRADELEALTQAIRGASDLSPLREATVEANPGTVDLAWLQRARAAGWDRLSLGVQCLDDGLLKRLGRIHDSAEALRVVALARRAGFRRLSCDLLVGVPGQRLGGVLEDAERLAEAGATHLSAYLLDLDKACPLKAEIESGRLALPTEDEVADVFEALQERLPGLGLFPYEISNFAQPGQESLHNLRYWERRPYLGLGPSAASQLGRWRWTESGVIPAWAEGRGGAELQELDGAEALAEIPMLGLRLHRGVDWAALRARALGSGLSPLVEAWEARLKHLAGPGLTEWAGDRVKLTSKGMLVSNGILSMFV
jgi:oxygen-independent coproporphyrinogen III oxidase